MGGGRLGRKGKKIKGCHPISDGLGTGEPHGGRGSSGVEGRDGGTLSGRSTRGQRRGGQIPVAPLAARRTGVRSGSLFDVMGRYRTPDGNAEARSPQPGIRMGRMSSRGWRRWFDREGSAQAFLQIAAGMAGRVVSGDGLRRALGGQLRPPSLGTSTPTPTPSSAGVAVLGEDHQLLMRRSRGPRDRAVTIANGRLPGPAVPSCSREDLAEQARELAPLGIRASTA